MSRKRYEWKCPNCGAAPNECGKGRCKGKYINYGVCEGFICECEYDECDYDDPDHGHYLDKPCQNAVCHHCGWHGEFPQVDKRTEMITKIKKKLEAQGCKDAEKTAEYLMKYVMKQIKGQW